MRVNPRSSYQRKFVVELLGEDALLLPALRKLLIQFRQSDVTNPLSLQKKETEKTSNNQ